MIEKRYEEVRFRVREIREKETRKKKRHNEKKIMDEKIRGKSRCTMQISYYAYRKHRVVVKCFRCSQRGSYITDTRRDEEKRKERCGSRVLSLFAARLCLSIST